VKCHHNSKNGAEQSDIRSIGCDRADDDKAPGQFHFKGLNVGKFREIHPPIVEPSLNRDCHRPDAQGDQQADNSVLDRILQHVHSPFLQRLLLMVCGKFPCDYVGIALWQH
jgi:hypothetical protein